MKIFEIVRPDHLYHATSLTNLVQILESNRMSSGNGTSNSFTRDFRFARLYSWGGLYHSVLVVDRTKLTHNYSIMPYAEMTKEPDNPATYLRPYDDSSFLSRGMRHGRYEAEEIVRGPIGDIRKYITRVFLVENPGLFERQLSDMSDVDKQKALKKANDNLNVAMSVIKQYNIPVTMIKNPVDLYS